jgi:hypothetical protein
MSNQKIKILQNILKAKGKFDLAIKFENAYMEDYQIDSWNRIVGEVRIYVNPIYFLDLNGLTIDNRSLILQIINGFFNNYEEIENFQFAINDNIPQAIINDAIYIFVDESGDMDFSSKGSKYYMFSFLVKNRPFQLHEYIANYRYELLERNLDPLSQNKILDIEAFHACEDNKYIRGKIFEIIETFPIDAVKTYSYILEKAKVNPDKRAKKEVFYAENLAYAITHLLDKIGIDKNFVIITDRLPVESNKKLQIKALKTGISEYLKSCKKQLRYTIHHHCSASSSNLQIVDYICWAINRKYEHDDDTYYKRIKKYLIEEEVVTKDRKVLHY